MSEGIVAGIARADAVLLGPATYQLFARLWPQQTDDVPMAKFLNHSLKYVMSKTPNKVGKLEWEPAILLKGEFVSALTKLKAEPGKSIQVPGSPRLVRSLLHEGLLDELSLTICPEIVGSGMRLFDEVTDHVRLTVEQSRISSNGAISVTYRPLRSGAQATAKPFDFPTAAVRKQRVAENHTLALGTKSDDRRIIMHFELWEKTDAIRWFVKSSDLKR